MIDLFFWSEHGKRIMGQVHANWEHMGNFVWQLTQFQEGCHDLLSALDANYLTLCETWVDDEQVKFDEVYQEFRRSFNHFAEFIDDAKPHLSRKVDHLRAYQGG